MRRAISDLLFAGHAGLAKRSRALPSPRSPGGDHGAMSGAPSRGWGRFLPGSGPTAAAHGRPRLPRASRLMVNPYGALYGSPEYATDIYPIPDPKTHTVTSFIAPVRNADTPEALGPGH